MTTTRRKALIALGSNLPSAESGLTSTLDRAVRLLGDHPKVTLQAVSRWYRTPAWPPGSGPDFVNGALSITTELDAQALLGVLHQIEGALGRERRQRWAPRTCDLDLIAYSNQVLPDLQRAKHWIAMGDDEAFKTPPDGLVLPHPRMHKRAFVLVPLCEIAPEWVHPVLGQSVRALVQALPAAARAEVEPIDLDESR